MTPEPHSTGALPPRGEERYTCECSNRTDKKALRSRFAAALNEQFGVYIGPHAHHTPDRPQHVRLCNGTVIVRSVLRYGYTEGQVKLLNDLAEKRAQESAARRQHDKDNGLEVDQAKGAARKNRYTRGTEIGRRKGLLRRFKKLVKSAETLKVCPQVAEKLGLLYFDPGLNKQPAGTLFQQMKSKYRYRCMAHIYGPFFHGVKIPPDEDRHCAKCYENMQIRPLCRMCARIQPDHTRVTCLTGQCPSKCRENESDQWGNAWRKKCKQATWWLNGVNSYRCSKKDRMDWLEGQYLNAFELVKEHDAMVNHGAKSITRERPHQAYGDSRGSSLNVSYARALMR